MSIIFERPAFVKESLIHSFSDYAHFENFSHTLKRQAERCSQIYAEVFHPLRDKFESAWGKDKVPKTFEAVELEVDDVSGCCCWGTHKVCSVFGSAIEGASNAFIGLKAWGYAILLYIAYGVRRLLAKCKGEFETEFEKDLEVLLDKMKQVASASGKSGSLSETDAIALGQRVHIKKLLPELRDKFFNVLAKGTAYEKKRAFEKLHAFLTSSDSEECWAISKYNMPNLGEVLLLGNRELGVKGLMNDDNPGENLVLELLQDDDYFVAEALRDVIPPEDLAIGFLDSAQAGFVVDSLFLILPEWTKADIGEVYTAVANPVSRKVKDRLEYRAASRRLSPVAYSEKDGDRTTFLDQKQKGDVLASYMGWKLRHVNALDPQEREAWVANFRRTSVRKRNQKLARHLWRHMEEEISKRYLKILHEREVLPALRKAIDEMYPKELRELMSQVEDTPSFEEQTALTVAHIAPDRFAEIFSRDVHVGRKGLVETHRLAVEKVRPQYERAGQSVPKKWHPTMKKMRACETALVEMHKKARLDAYNKAQTLARKYVEQLKFTRNASADFRDQELDEDNEVS